MASSSIPVFDIASGYLVFLSFVCFCFCVATLKNHVDATKLKTPEEVNLAIRNPIPKREILTKQGLVRYKLAIVSLLVSMATVAVIVVRKLAN